MQHLVPWHVVCVPLSAFIPLVLYPPPCRPTSTAMTQQKDMDKVIDIVGEDYRLSMSGFLFVFRKDMFRDTTFKCRGFAGPDVTEEEIMTSGQCGCLDFDLTEVRIRNSKLLKCGFY